MIFIATLVPEWLPGFGTNTTVFLLTLLAVARWY